MDTIEPSKEAGTQTPDELQSFQYLYIDGIKHEFVHAFQEAFGDENMPPQYRYDSSSEKSQIQIYRNHPNRLSKFPCLIVESNSGDAGMNFFGSTGEFFGETTINDVEYYYYGGLLTLDVSIHICAKSITDLSRITDITMLLMRYVFKNAFYKRNLAFNKIKISGESFEGEDKEKVYKNIITTKVTTNFKNLLSKDFVTKIQNIIVQPG